MKTNSSFNQSIAERPIKPETRYCFNNCRKQHLSHETTYHFQTTNLLRTVLHPRSSITFEYLHREQEVGEVLLHRSVKPL